MSIKKKGLGKGLDSLIPDNKSIKSVTPDKSAEAKKESEVRKLIRFLQENIQRFPVSSESWYWYFILPLM